LALVQKIPTPIKPVQINQQNRTITLAYFEQKSTVDYIGIVQGISICFDAKETKAKSLPIANIHKHQIEFMEDFTNQGGLSFLIVNFSTLNKYYLLPFDQLYKHWLIAENGGKKSISHKNFDNNLEINIINQKYIHYLSTIKAYFNL